MTLSVGVLSNKMPVFLAVFSESHNIIISYFTTKYEIGFQFQVSLGHISNILRSRYNILKT